MTVPVGDSAIDANVLRATLKSQYHAALAMLRSAIEACPDELWSRDGSTNAFWQIAYHALFFTHLYLQPEEAAFEPWPRQKPAQHPDGIAGDADPDSPLPLIPEPYTRAEVLDYLAHVAEAVDPALDAMDLQRTDSGFHWYRVSKLEHQIINIRHVQHHAAQLADRLRNDVGAGTRWVAARRTARQS